MPDARLTGRLHKELKMLQDPPPGVCVWPADDSDLSRLEAQIQGPDGTVYAKGIFKLEVEIPDRYPFEPPNVKFVTPVYHPNIDSGGRICHDILNMPPKGQWRPSLNIGAVLASIRVLLEEPNHDDGLMSDISAEYKHNRALFDNKARQSTERYAMQNSAERDVTCQNVDQAKAMTSHSASSENQPPEKANQGTLARPVVKEVNRIGASKVVLDEPSTSAPGVAAPRLTQARPHQNLGAKLSLAKGATTQGVRSCSLGVIGEAEPTSSLSFNSQKERPRETDITCGLGSQNISQPELKRPCVTDAGETVLKHENGTTVVIPPVDADEKKLDSKAAKTIRSKQPATRIVTKDKQPNTEPLTSQSKGKKLMLPKSKLLKLSRPQSLASQHAKESTPAGELPQGASEVKGTEQMSKKAVILLDSESDDENFRVQARPQGGKRKYERT